MKYTFNKIRGENAIYKGKKSPWGKYHKYADLNISKLIEHWWEYCFRIVSPLAYNKTKIAKVNRLY